MRAAIAMRRASPVHRAAEKRATQVEKECKKAGKRDRQKEFAAAAQ